MYEEKLSLHGQQIIQFILLITLRLYLGENKTNSNFNVGMLIDK